MVKLQKHWDLVRDRCRRVSKMNIYHMEALHSQKDHCQKVWYIAFGVSWWRLIFNEEWLQHQTIFYSTMHRQKNVKGAHCSKSKFYLAKAAAWIHFYWLAGSFMQMHHWRHHKIGRWTVQSCFLKVCGWCHSHFSGIIFDQVCFGHKLSYERGL